MGKFIRVVAIIIFATMTAMMLLGGIGTSCVAWGLENYEDYAMLVNVQWLYQLVSVVTIALGVFGIWIAISLGRGKQNSYRNAIIMMVIGLIGAGAQMFVSEALRGTSAPNNMRVYLTAFTLVMFLLLRIPGVWQKVDFDRGAREGSAGTPIGLAMMATGLLIMTVHIWAGPTHTMGGVNYADVWHNQLFLAGFSFLTLGGVILAISWAAKRGWLQQLSASRSTSRISEDA